MKSTRAYLKLRRYLDSGLFDRIKTILLEHKARDGEINLTKADLLKKLKEVSDDLLPEINEALDTLKKSNSFIIRASVWCREYQRCYEELERNGWSLYERWKRSNFDINVRDSDGDTLLHNVCKIPHDCYSSDGRDSIDYYITAEWLIKNGAFVNAVGHKNLRPLHLAACSIDPEVVKLLIDHGADPNALYKREDNNKTYRVTALSFAQHIRNFIKNDYPYRSDENEQIINILSPITTVKDYSSVIPFYTYQLSLAFFCTAVAAVCSMILEIQSVAFSLAVVSGICLILAVTKYCLVKSMDNMYMRQVMDANEQEKNLSNKEPEVQTSMDNASLTSFEVLHHHQ